MKVRDSGMPPIQMWESFFDVDSILKELLVTNEIKSLVEIGSGYGTFTIPVSKIIDGKVYAFDIDSEMIEGLQVKLTELNIHNVITEKRDILVDSTGLESASVDYVMLFNILHHELPLDFLSEAFRILKSGGRIGIIHWRSDISTPRGPDLNIRPRPEDILSWINYDQFVVEKGPIILEPYHFGIVLAKK